MSWQQTQPYNIARLITTSATVNFDGTVASSTGLFGTSTNTKPTPCEAIQCDNGGAIVVVLEDSTTATITTVAGQILPIKAIRVNSTGTTVTGNMYALYTV